MLSNPSEQKFLESVASNYSSQHGGMEMSVSQLIKMGESERNSYLIFSTYSYEFGTIGVEYFGMAYMTFYLGSYKSTVKANEDVVVYNN